MGEVSFTPNGMYLAVLVEVPKEPRWPVDIRGALVRVAAGLCRVVTLISAWGALASAQRTITGTVVDQAGTAVAYANVQHGAQRAVADDSGRFLLTAPASGVTLRARRIGFQPTDVSVAAGGDTSISIVLTALPQALAREVVSATATVRSLELSGFYRRLHERRYGTNAGQFITSDDIAARNPTRVSQMFEGLTGIRNLRVKTNDRTHTCGGFTSLLCWAPQGPGGCWMAVYYDGRRMLPVDGFSRNSAPTLIDETVLPGHVAAIEVYSTPGKVPPEFQSLNGTCGVVLVWSR